MSGLVGNSRTHVLSCRGSNLFLKCKFLASTNQTSRYIRKCIRIGNLTQTNERSLVLHEQLLYFNGVWIF